MLHVVGVGADQIDVKSPIALGIKAPIVEREAQLEFRGRLAATRAASLDAQLIRRIGEFAFQLIPVEIAVLCVRAFCIAGKGGGAQRARYAPLPLKLPCYDLRFRVGTSQAVDEVVPRGEVFGIDHYVERSVNRAQGTMKLNAARWRCDFA